MLNDEVLNSIPNLKGNIDVATEPVNDLYHPIISAQQVNRLVQEHLNGVAKTTEKASEDIIEKVITVDGVISTLVTQLQNAILECENVRKEGMNAITSLQKSLDEMGVYVKQREEESIIHEKNTVDILAETKKLSNFTAEMNRMTIFGSCLALNAAAQAARVGGHGAGFKVIAEEVRTMSASYKKISGLIDKSIYQVVEKVAGEQAAMLDSSVIENDVQRLSGFTSELEALIQFFSRYDDINSGAFSDIADSADQAGSSVMDMLASIQFQDITRQQLDTVKMSLNKVNNYFDEVISLQYDSEEFAELQPMRIDDFIQTYVMEEQRQVHQEMFDDGSDVASESNNIEFF